MLRGLRARFADAYWFIGSGLLLILTSPTGPGLALLLGDPSRSGLRLPQILSERVLTLACAGKALNLDGSIRSYRRCPGQVFVSWWRRWRKSTSRSAPEGIRSPFMPVGLGYSRSAAMPVLRSAICRRLFCRAGEWDHTDIGAIELH